MQLVAIKGTVPPQAREFSTEEVQAMQRAVIRLFDHWGVTDGSSRARGGSWRRRARCGLAGPATARGIGGAGAGWLSADRVILPRRPP